MGDWAQVQRCAFSARKTEVQGDGHLTFDALKCVKVCEAPYQAPSSIPSSPFSPPEGLVLEGDEVRAKCRPRNGGQMPLSLGESRMRCGSDGLFRPIGKPPICAPTCKNNFDKAYFLLEERRAAANEILSEYATEVNSKLAWQPMKVAEGGFFKYSCRNECITMGNRKQTCMDGLLDGHGQQMFCGCLLELRLTKMVFDDSWRLRYLSQQKFHLEDVGKEQLILKEIHLTVCSRHGKRSLFSSCGIFAETSADSLNLVPFIEGGSSHTGNFDLPLAVKHQEGGDGGDVLKDLSAKSIEASLVHFNRAISALQKGRQWRSALDVLVRIDLFEIEADPQIWF
eukprot:g7883.t1